MIIQLIAIIGSFLVCAFVITSLILFVEYVFKKKEKEETVAVPVHVLRRWHLMAKKASNNSTDPEIIEELVELRTQIKETLNINFGGNK